MKEKIKKTKKIFDENVKTDIFSNNLREKITFYENIIQETILSIQKYKYLDIISANELNISTQNLESILNDIKNIKKFNETKLIIEKIEAINTSIHDIIKQYGTNNIGNMMTVSFGKDYVNSIKNNEKFKIINKYIRPLSFKLLTSNEKKNKTPLVKNKIIEDFMISENAANFECFDLGRTTKQFQLKVYGIKIAIRNTQEKKILIINGLCDDLMLSSLSNDFFINKIENLKFNKPEENDFNSEIFNHFIESLSIKDLLIYNHEELYFKFSGIINQLHLIKQKNISQIVKDFLTSELYSQRRILINMLLPQDDPEFQYLAYLLYDLMSNDVNGNIDTQEQTCLFDSLPWNIKKKFRLAMKQTIQYTNKLTNFDSNKIPLEQQICLLKANDIVKEKAMVKLKEVKAKTDDTGSKARQYLEGLLKIPFGTYKKEPILSVMKNIKNELDESKEIIKSIVKSDKYDSINCYNIKQDTTNDLYNNVNNNVVSLIIKSIDKIKRNKMIEIINSINKIIKKKKYIL